MRLAGLVKSAGDWVWGPVLPGRFPDPWGLQSGQPGAEEAPAGLVLEDQFL